MSDASPIPAVLVIAVVTVMVIASRLQQQTLEAEQQEEWASAAKQLGLTFVPRRGPWYSRTKAHIEGQLSGTVVRLETYAVQRGKSSQPFTRAIASAAHHPAGYSLELETQGMLSKVGTFLGGQDVIVGHPQFDQAFVVKTNSVSLTKRILLRPITSMLVDFPGATFTAASGSVTALASGTITDRRAVIALIRTAASLAEGPGRVLSQWKALAEAIGGTLSLSNIWTKAGTLPAIELEPRGVPLRVEATDDPAHVVLMPADDPTKSVHVAEDAAHIEQAIDTMTSAAANVPYRA